MITVSWHSRLVLFFLFFKKLFWCLHRGISSLIPEQLVGITLSNPYLSERWVLWKGQVALFIITKLIINFFSFILPFVLFWNPVCLFILTWESNLWVIITNFNHIFFRLFLCKLKLWNVGRHITFLSLVMLFWRSSSIHNIYWLQWSFNIGPWRRVLCSWFILIQWVEFLFVYLYSIYLCLIKIAIDPLSW